MERVAFLEKSAIDKDEQVQGLADSILEHQEKQANTITTLLEHVDTLDSFAIGVSHIQLEFK